MRPASTIPIRGAADLDPCDSRSARLPYMRSTKALEYFGYFLYWLPRVFTVSVVLWGLVSHVRYTGEIANRLARALLLTLGVFSGVCAEIAYCRTFIVGPGSPREFAEFAPATDLEMQANLGPHAPHAGPADPLVGPGPVPEILRDAIEAKSDGGARYCSKCFIFKPDRAHHCRQCGICVLRMDHHCIWFSCCIGLHNHKYFLQFLVYVSLLCVAAFTTAVPVLVRFFRDQQYARSFMSINFVLYTVLSGVFGLVLPMFTAYSLYNAAVNRTTLESMEGSPYRTSLPANQWRYRRPPSRDNLGNIYDVGVVRNLDQLFGTTWLEWLLPINSRRTVDGTRFPINEELRAKAEERAQTELAMHRKKQQFMEQQQQQLEQGTYLPAE